MIFKIGDKIHFKKDTTLNIGGLGANSIIVTPKAIGKIVEIDTTPIPADSNFVTRVIIHFEISGFIFPVTIMTDWGQSATNYLEHIT